MKKWRIALSCSQCGAHRRTGKLHRLSRSIAISRSSTTVIETHGSVEGDLSVSMPTARSREFGNSSLIELIRSVRGTLRTASHPRWTKRL